MMHGHKRLVAACKRIRVLGPVYLDWLSGLAQGLL